MAKAKAEASLMGELFQGRLFKPRQGRVVRQVTGLAVAAIFVAMAWRLHATVLLDVGNTFTLRFPGTSSGVDLPGSLVRLGLPVLLGLTGCWLGFRLVNWPPFANFLISVEAEMDKVSWASMEYLKRATAVVVVLMFFLGAYLFMCDVFWQQLFMMIGFLDGSAVTT
ncbi:preprotein translocase subunit SecE [Planctomicrobium sp. SH661]|uniref:preprotein translocase subunit SecE n=1 Tax=Planctomicrobium sp. SH661 TaxID=3448124 RepID=UPI003F5CABFC